MIRRQAIAARILKYNASVITEKAKVLAEVKKLAEKPHTAPASYDAIKR